MKFTSKEFVIGAIGAGGILMTAGFVIRNMNMKKYSPKPLNENHIFRSEVGDEYADKACNDLKNKETEFSKREFNRYSE